MSLTLCVLTYLTLSASTEEGGGGEAARRRGDQASRGEESEGVVSLPGAGAAKK